MSLRPATRIDTPGVLDPPGPLPHPRRSRAGTTLTWVTLLVVLCGFAPSGPDTEPAVPTTDSPRPLLWAIDADSCRSYVFGTIHLADPRVLDLPPSVLEALESCDALRTEIPLDAATLAEVGEAMLLPEEQTLQDVLPAALVDRLESFLEQHQQRLEPYERMKPWVLASLLTLVDSPNLFEQPLDQRLHDRARRAGKRTGGLETVAEQLDVLDSLSPATAAALLEDTLDLLESDSDALEDLVQAYLSGDEHAILDLVTTYESGTQPEVETYLQRLIDERNVLLAERMIALLERHPQRRFFFALGAGHLPGDDGILARLRRHGLPVTRAEE